MRIQLVRIALLISTLSTGSLCAESSKVDFVHDGEAVRVAESSGGWKRTDGFLVTEVDGARLIAGQQIGPGDFHVTAELVLEKMARSAATLKLGGSHFGFVGAHGKIFLTGALFDGARGLPIGDPADFMTDGKAFTIEAIRKGGRLRFLIDGKLVHERAIHRRAIGEIGLSPARARMKVRQFRAVGTLADTFVIPLDPPYVVKQVAGVEKNRLLPPGPGNARNSEGDFVQLKDGRVLFIYSHFTGGGSDHAAGHLASRVSSDGGRTWTKEDGVVLEQSGAFNDMSVSLLRLQNGSIALFYARKNSMLDCRPVMRISTDEGQSWGDPVECITDEVGYYVLNNDRVIQLRDGRLIMAVSLHNLPSYKMPNWNGHVMCYFSDDSGATWRRNKTVLAPTDSQGKRLIAQEPGLIELKGERLMMFIRSNAGSQLISYSEDRGETFSTARPSTMISPVSPATIERIPTTGDLLLAWNDHNQVDELHKGKRTPYRVAISRDEGKNWTSVKTLEDDPNGWYCYTAMDFVSGHVLLGHCAGDRRTGGLNVTQITRFPIDWLYADATVKKGPDAAAESSQLLKDVVPSKVRAKLKSARAELKIVCFGDSVTGLYYHTGGERTYTDMLGIGLKQIHPGAKLTMINAGVSGNTTQNGLARIDRDVLAHDPDLVTVMFGLNDMARLPGIETYRDNLVEIVKRCRVSGAEVVLCTPNSVITTPARPKEKLVKYCDVVREVAATHQVPLCDTFTAFEAFRKRDPLAWRMTLSDQIHPNMAGHKMIAEELSLTISGKRASLSGVGPLSPAIGKTLALLKAGKPIRVLAMPPFDAMIGDALKTVISGAEVEIIRWPIEGLSLEKLERDAAQRVRKLKPNLVLIAVPRSAKASSQEQFLHAQIWTMNYSLSFGKREWDVVVVHPSVADPGSSDPVHDELVRRLTAAQDLTLIDRSTGNSRTAGGILLNWLRTQKELLLHMN